MKQTRTVLKELTAMYRAVLRHGILCNAIALGLIATAPAMAEYTNVSLDELYPTGTAGSFKYTGNQNVTWLAENISVTEPGDGRAIEIGKNAVYSATEPTLLHLGGDNTNTININTGGDGILVRTKSVVDVRANDTISITSTVNDPAYDGGVGYGALWVQNSSDPGQTDTYATVNLTANQINLTNLNASAIAALSEGRVNINGNATIKGKDAIYASGLSVTNINAAGDKTVKMDGDIDFRQGPNSGAPVDATVNVTLNGAESYWTGNTVLSYEDKPSDDKLQINHGATIKMTDGATWTATEVAESAEPGVATNGRYYTALKNLDVNSGNVVVNRANGIEVENLAVGAGGLTINSGDMTVSESLKSTGRTNIASGAGLTVNATKGASFKGSEFSGAGGAIFAATGGSLDIDYAKFENNTATNGGAITNLGTSELTIDNSIFTGNTVATNGGAIQNNATVDAEISNTTFSGNYTGKSSTGGSGGAIYNGSGKLTLTNNTFTGNGKLVDGNTETMKTGTGGAIYNNSGTLEISGGSITDNMANKAGAIYVASGSLSIDGTEITGNASTGGSGVIWVNGGNGFTINNATIDNNSGIKNDAPIYVVEGLGLVPAGTGATGNGGAIYNSTSGKTSTITGGSISQNVAATGGAIYNNKGTLNIDGTTFNGNVASGVSKTSSVIGGGAIRNLDTLNIKDATFTNNIAKEKGGAIFNAASKTITFDGSNTFSGNKSDVTWDEENGNITASTANDIYNNMGTINIISGAGETNTFAGGFDGVAGSKLYINGAGTTNIANTLKKHTVDVNSGELHLTNADLTGSTINVASGAIINTIDDAIQDLSSNITLADGAGIKGDIDWNNGTADKYASAAGTVKYYVGNLLNGDIGTGEKAFQVVSDGTTVDIAEAIFTSDTGVTFNSSGVADGQMIVRGFAGGINTAVETTDADGARLALNYTVTENEVFDSDDSIDNSDFRITGTGADGFAIELQKDLNVSENAMLSLNDVKFTGSSDIVNKAGATLNIKDSFIGVNVNNFGVLKSDPTTYAGTVNNVAGATAEFDNDTFGATATLANAGTVDLKNGVKFASGASITGAGVMNLVSGTTVFNDTANTNNVFVANGAGFSGSLIGGSLDTRNNNIDTGLGTVQNANLYVDANLKGATPAIDSFAGTTGSTIKSINLTSSEYGTADSITLAVGDATLSDDLQITGAMNYYTKVEKDGTNLVFSDKLVNASGMKANARLADYDNTTSGLTATTLQGAIDENATNVAAINTTLGTYGDVVTHDAAEFASAAQGTKADSAIQSVKVNGTALTPDAAKAVDITAVTGIKIGTGAAQSGEVTLGTTAATNLAANLDAATPTDAEIATWAADNATNVATVGTTFDVLSKKLMNVQSDLMAAGDNASSIAHALGAATGVGLIDQVNAMADARIVASTVDAADLHTAILTIDGSSVEAKDKRNALGALLTTGANAGKTLTAASTAEAVAEYMKLSADVMSQYDFGWDLNTGLPHDLVAGKMKIDVLNDASVTDKTVAGAINANTAAIANIATTATTAWNQAEAWMNTALGIDSTANDADDALQAALGTTNYLGGDTSFSGALKTLDGQAKTNADAIATNATNIAANKDAIDVLNGDASTVGSVDYKIAGALSTVEAGVTAVYNQAHDWAENLLGVDVDENVNNQLQNALTSKEVIGSTTTIAGALSNLDAGVDALQNVVGDAQTTAATTGILSGEKIGDTVSLVDAVNTIATTAVGTDTDNTFTGTNTFEKQIVAEKGVKFGSDYSIDENGAATLASVTAANGFTVDANNTLTSTGLTAAAATIAGNATVGGTLGVTGALSGSTATFTGAVSADSLSATNGVSGKTLTATDSITLGTSTITSIDTAGLARNVAGSDSALATTSSVVATIKNQAEDATYTNTITSGSNVSGATLNAAIANLDATIGDMSGLNARDDANSVGNALANGGTTTPTTVVAALNNIDATLGTIHGLKTKLESAGTYKGNLATGTTVEEHLTAIDSAIGDRSSLASLNTAINNAAKTDVATALETTGNLIGNMTFDGTNYLASVTDLSEAVRVLDSNIAKVDHKVEKLEKKVNSGMASMAALTALVPNARDCGDTQISIGTGAYADRAGVAVGAFHYFNDHVLLNAGASYGGTSDWAFRAGITFGL